MNNVIDFSNVFSHYKDFLSFKEKLYMKLRFQILPIHKYSKYITDASSILSLGCGYGILEHYFASNLTRAKVLGIDSARRKIGIAKNASASLSNIEYRCLDVKRIGDLSPHRWDLVLANDLFHHLDYKTQELVIDKVSGLLKNGGIFIIKDINPRPSLRRMYNTTHDLFFNQAGTVYYRGLASYRNLLSKNCLVLDSVDGFNKFLFAHIFMVSSKIQRWEER